MNASKPAKCIFCSFTQAVTRAAPARRKFHTSPSQLQRKPKHPSIKQADMKQYKDLGLSRNYTKEDIEKLRQQYSPEQMAAIEASEKIISSKDITRTAERSDPWSPDYFDDLSSIHPVVDKPVRAPWHTADATPRLKTEDEIDQDLGKLLQEMPTDENSDDQVWENFIENIQFTVGGGKVEGLGRTAVAPEIPEFSKKKVKKDLGASSGDTSPALVRLMEMTGYSAREISSLRVKSIVVHSVTNQTRLGKIMKQYFLSIAGNGEGRIGIGEGSSTEAAEARLQSQYRAIRNMQPILRYENRTIFGDVKGKVSATELELYARPPGFGLRCQKYIWEVCKCAGISDLAARVTRSRNPMNTVKATVEALQSQKDPEDIARARGKKMVDVRKVYYAGKV